MLSAATLQVTGSEYFCIICVFVKDRIGPAVNARAPAAGSCARDSLLLASDKGFERRVTVNDLRFVMMVFFYLL